jgi:hypothetical protein
MAGKTPLLLATVFFSIGALGLVLTSAERADWGPFQPGPQPQRLVLVEGRPYIEPPSLAELMTAPVTAVADEPLFVAAPQSAAPETSPEPTPTPVAPLRVFGISADDAGVSVAAVTPPTPPPITIGGIASDDEPSAGTPEPTETPQPLAVPAQSETPSAD